MCYLVRMDTQPDVKAIAAGLERIVSASPLTKRSLAEKAGLNYEKLLKQLDGDTRIDVVDFRRLAKALGMDGADLMREVESEAVAA